MTTHPVDGVIHTRHREPRQGGLEAVEQRSAARKHLHKTLETSDKESRQTEQRDIQHVAEGQGGRGQGGRWAKLVQRPNETFTSQTFVDVLIFP